MVTRTVDAAIVPNRRKLPNGSIGVILLGRLAVDKTAQGQGLGQRCLIRAMQQVARAAEDVGIFALVLDAKDDRAGDWYLHLGFGFEPLLDDPNHLYLPVATIREHLNDR